MPRRSFLLTIAVALSLPLGGAALAQQSDPAVERLEKSPRHHEFADIAAGERTVRAFVVYPEVDRAATAAIVIHENRGLTNWVRGVADQLAEAGYVAIAPDFLSGAGPGGGGTDSFGGDDAARTGIGQLPPEQVIADLDAVFQHAKSMPAANGTVAVCGFCWGGGKTFAYAAHNPDVAAAFVFYGTAPGPDQLEKIKVPVYGFYGGNDFRITGQVPATQEALKGEGQVYEPVTYEGAGHGFMRQGESPEAKPEDKTARDMAWERWKELLKGL